MKKYLILSFILLFALILIAGCSSAPAAIQPSSSNPGSTSSSANGGTTAVADGQTLLNTRCTTCHTLAQVVNHTGTADQWKSVVDRMIQNGAQLSSQEEAVLVKYLAANFK